MIDFLRDMARYMKVTKKYWLLPFLLVILFFGVLIFVTQGSAVAPFIYTLF